jgi:hypothetical protein
VGIVLVFLVIAITVPHVVRQRRQVSGPNAWMLSGWCPVGSSVLEKGTRGIVFAVSASWFLENAGMLALTHELLQGAGRRVNAGRTPLFEYRDEESDKHENQDDRPSYQGDYEANVWLGSGRVPGVDGGHGWSR